MGLVNLNNILENMAMALNGKQSLSLDKALAISAKILENKLRNPKTGRMVGSRYLRRLSNTMKVARVNNPMETPSNLEPSMVIPMASIGVVSESDK